jgi:hypothetical protein
MTFFRNVLHDLIQKKLWPVAIALVAAVVAVPVVLGSGGSSADTGTGSAAAPTGAGGLANHRDAARAQVVSIAEQATGAISRAGTPRDPFVQHHMPKPAKLQQTVTSAVQTAKNVVGSIPTSGGSGSSGGGGATAPTTPAKPAPAKPTGTVDDAYRVSLRFGENGAQKTYDNLARLTPLPSADNPFFVFLGLKPDAKSAVFLVSSDAVPSGDGTCEPTPDNCQQVVLKDGDIEFFELQTGTAGVVQYQLELTAIKKYKASKASAAVAHARESRAGREALRAIVATNPTALDNWDYSKQLGVLIAKTPVTANVPQDIAEAAAGQPVQDTSTVMTVPAPPQP